MLAVPPVVKLAVSVVFAITHAVAFPVIVAVALHLNPASIVGLSFAVPMPFTSIVKAGLKPVVASASELLSVAAVVVCVVKTLLLFVVGNFTL